ncbi:uncharacterized protein K452DRAFT_252669 [Aplosporella prunicola CBS 121167]|uniref:Palmitoyltransferase n=1 Tax=Aplosporella prunicola CBS 121167 TaxID=1176127 RepID=A0A6A6B9N3_9PEZI|nr:uncharacterized protein K452DRAFT_252669 [Aplosporella prunicola CBS 121167]KAF2140780.1 hypothetical protein K452DRAFT_252669 [Aplosporella prunicola CBS 121167]
MATLASDSPPPSPSYTMRRKSLARKCERYICGVFSYFPLAIVYGLTTWAVWVSTQIDMLETKTKSKSHTSAVLAVIFYAMLNWCYTTAVFTDPGSPIDTTKSGYSSLPTQEVSRPYTSFTVKSTGELRFCKKCQTRKPDRAHHCSTCKRCVLKMDHHCPWLATCVGLRNYKPFLLFLVYLSIFCWISFAASGGWCWNEFTNDSYMDNLMPVNYIVLAVISGIVGLVITGFTAWHIMLAARGTTTIESLEKTRYLSPLRKSKQQFNAHHGQRNYVDGDIEPRTSIGDAIMEVPGVTRPEEGEEYSMRNSPAERSLRRNWAEVEAQRERDRYNEYLEELDSEKLPNAFDLGWKRNMMHVLGENRILWFLPICNTTGDGWQWEASQKWVAERERIAEERFTQMQRQKDRERAAGWGIDSPPRRASPPPRISYTVSNNRNSWGSIPTKQKRDSRFLMTSDGLATVPLAGRRSPNKADQILGRAPGLYSDDPLADSMGMGVQMQNMPPRRSIYGDLEDDDDDDDYEDSSDEGPATAELAEARRKASLALAQAQLEGRRPSRAEIKAEMKAAAAEATSTTATAAATTTTTAENWNDVPDDMFSAAGKARAAVRKKRAEEEWQEWGPS